MIGGKQEASSKTSLREVRKVSSAFLLVPHPRQTSPRLVSNLPGQKKRASCGANYEGLLASKPLYSFNNTALCKKQKVLVRYKFENSSPLTTGGLAEKVLRFDVEKLERIPLVFLTPLLGLMCVMGSNPEEGPEPTTIQPLGVIAAAGGAFSLWRSSSKNCRATTPKLVSNCSTSPWRATTSSWNNQSNS